MDCLDYRGDTPDPSMTCVNKLAMISRRTTAVKVISLRAFASRFAFARPNPTWIDQDAKMPFKIPFTRLVVTGHRGTAITNHLNNRFVKALFHQPKDEKLDPRTTAREDMPVKRPRMPIPVASVKRSTPYTALTDDAAIERAAAKKSKSVKAAGEATAAVTQFIQSEKQRFLSEAGMEATPVILVGGSHGSISNFSAALAAIQAAGPGATVLFERNPTQFATTLQNAYNYDTANPAALNLGVKNRVYYSNADTRERTLENLLVLSALKSGARVDCYDRGRTGATSMEDREQQMLQGIEAHLRSMNGPVVVITGTHHLPKLHDNLECLHDVIAIAEVSPKVSKPEEVDARKRSSYILSTDRILKLRDEGINASKPDIVQLANSQVGMANVVPWTSPGKTAMYVNSARSNA
jgi:hypothetical protein